MTENLFWSDPYSKKFKAKILSIQGKEIVLDKTAFYPTSGGQPHDLGKLNIRGQDYCVVDVEKRHNNIVHHIKKSASPDDIKGIDVIGEIDWKRRYNLMKAHTSQHLLSAFIFKNYQSTTVDLSIDEEEVSIHLDKPINSDQLQNALKAVSKIVSIEGKKVRSHVISQNKAKSKFSGVVRGKMTEEEPVRILEIEGWDIMCCGGTHVKNTREIGIIALDQFKRGKDIRYKVGYSGVDAAVFSQIFHVKTSELLNTSREKVENLLRKRLESLEVCNSSLWASHELLLDYLVKLPGRIRNGIKIHVISLDLERKLVTGKFSDFPENSVLISISPDNKLLILSNSSNFDAKVIMSLLKEKFNIRGGGSPRMSQGMVINAPDDLLAQIKNVLFKN